MKSEGGKWMKKVYILMGVKYKSMNRLKLDKVYFF